MFARHCQPRAPASVAYLSFAAARLTARGAAPTTGTAGAPRRAGVASGRVAGWGLKQQPRGDHLGRVRLGLPGRGETL